MRPTVHDPSTLLAAARRLSWWQPWCRPHRVRGPGLGPAGHVDRDQGLRRLPQAGERADLPAVGQQQALPGQRRLLRVPHGQGRRAGRLQARRPVDRHDRLAQGLRPLPRARKARSSPIRTTPRAHGSSARWTTPWRRWSKGNRGMVTPAFQKGVSAAAVSGCWQCHGSEVKVLPGGKLDPATWPNTGIGRINPDGSEGSCSACHSRHSFSAVPGPASRTTAASATWAPTIRRWRSTTSRSTASPSARSRTS